MQAERGVGRREWKGCRVDHSALQRGVDLGCRNGGGRGSQQTHRVAEAACSTYPLALPVGELQGRLARSEEFGLLQAVREDRLRIPGIRSEEHTSELQSLMRI